MVRSWPRFTRLRRAIRFILGPATPTPDSELSPPITPLTSSFTLPNHRACTTIPDRGAYKLAKSLRLPYLLVPVLLLWATANVLLVREQYFSPSSPPTIGCTDALWSDWPPDICGLDGTECNAALQGDGGGRYRCLGGCSYSPLGNPRWVGGDEIDRRPLVIGGNGNNTYRCAFPTYHISSQHYTCSADHQSRFLGVRFSYTFWPNEPYSWRLRERQLPSLPDHPILDRWMVTWSTLAIFTSIPRIIHRDVFTRQRMLRSPPIHQPLQRPHALPRHPLPPTATLGPPANSSHPGMGTDPTRVQSPIYPALLGIHLRWLATGTVGLVLVLPGLVQEISAGIQRKAGRAGAVARSRLLDRDRELDHIRALAPYGQDRVRRDPTRRSGCARRPNTGGGVCGIVAGLGSKEIWDAAILHC